MARNKQLICLRDQARHLRHIGTTGNSAKCCQVLFCGRDASLGKSEVHAGPSEIFGRAMISSFGRAHGSWGLGPIDFAPNEGFAYANHISLPSPSKLKLRSPRLHRKHLVIPPIVIHYACQKARFLPIIPLESSYTRNYSTQCYGGRLRVFKTRSFARLIRNTDISDQALREAVERAVKGLVDA